MALNYEKVATNLELANGAAFKEKVKEVKDLFFPAPDWTEERIVVYPQIAEHFAQAVRDHLGKALPTHVILSALLNLHK